MGVTRLVNKALISGGTNGVDVGVGVSEMAGVRVTLGVDEIVGVRVMVGVIVMVGVRLGVVDGA